MTKRDIVLRISEETGLYQDTVQDVVQRVLDYITEAVARRETVELRRFGVFEVRVRKARVGRNPNQPETNVPIPERTIVKFKPGKEMRERVLLLPASDAGTPPAPAAPVSKPAPAKAPAPKAASARSAVPVVPAAAVKPVTKPGARAAVPTVTSPKLPAPVIPAAIPTPTPAPSPSVVGAGSAPKRKVALKSK